MTLSPSMLALTVGCALRASTEGQEAQLGALAGFEVTLGPVAQASHLGDIDLDDGGELCRGLQGLDHPSGNHLAQAGHRFGGASL
jgi:hypothetical protein